MNPCPNPECEVCLAVKRREARAKMTKAQLRADADAADEAYMEAAENGYMYKAYCDALEAHLRVHGCECNFGDVADDPKVVAA